MTAQLIDGRAIAAQVRSEVAEAITLRTEQNLPPPGLAVVIVGDNSASEVYVRNKQKACEQVGIRSKKFALPEHTKEDELLALVDELNHDDEVHGILVQLPLPAHIDTNRIIDRILPHKDVDGFHPHNIGLLAQSRGELRPCTPKGILTMLKRTLPELSGLRAVVIGASNIVGRPLALELMRERCTVTVCNSKTRNLPEVARTADILTVAVGKPAFAKADWIKPGAVVIDVGINRQDDGRLVGDVDFESAKNVAGWITPVPGGVGPMTVATLLENTLKAAVNI